jgi:hypothetical protein
MERQGISRSHLCSAILITGWNSEQSLLAKRQAKVPVPFFSRLSAIPTSLTT